MNPVYFPLSMGLRLHNPLLINRSSRKFQGLSQDQTSRLFEFESTPYGYRAAFILIREYMQNGKFSLNDILKSFSRDAQPFIASQVSSMSAIPEFINITWKDEETMVALIHSMSIIANGMKYLEYISEDEIRQGYHLAFG